MNEPTLESLARRVAELETRLAAHEGKTPVRDWRSVVGMFDDSNVMPQIIEEGRRLREAERQAAEEGRFE